MPAAHTDGMARACGAVTTVVNQTTTFVRGRLWAVEGDPNSHSDGALVASGSTVFIEGKKVIVNSPDNAMPDALCIPLNGAHCAPLTAQGSMINFAYGPGGEGPPIEDPHPGVDLLTALGLTVGPPVLGTPVLVDVAVLAAQNLTVASPTLGSPVLRVVTVLTANGLTVAAPTLGTPELHALSNLVAQGLTVATPTLGSPAISQKHALSAASLTVAAPTLGTPDLRVVTILTADSLTVAEPTLGTPAIQQVHALTATSLTVAVPVLGTPSLGFPNVARREDGGAAKREDDSTEMRE